MSVYSGPEIPNDGLVLNLDGGNARSYSGSGTAWNDVSGNGNTGTLVNGPTYDSAYGGSLVFDGVNDYAKISYNSAFNVLATPFTVIVWNKKNNTTNGYNGLITADAASDNTWKIFKDVNLNFYKSRTGGTTLDFPNYTVNQWHMYAFTKSGSTLTNYFDGSLTAVDNAASNPVALSNDLAIGSYRLNDAIAGIHLMDQSFGPIMFYNRALSAEEIQQVYNATKNRYAPPPIVGNDLVLNLDAANFRSYSGTGTTWNDVSGNGNNGTLVNGPTYNSADSGAIVFDGVNDYATLSSKIIPATGAFTVFFTYALINAGGRGGFFERNTAIPYNGFTLGQGGTDNWAAAINGTSDFNNQTVAYFPFPTLNQIYVDSVVYNGSNTLTIYRNGVLVTTTTGVIQGNLDAGGNRSNLLIANRDNITSLACNVYNTQVYNRALSSEEVQQNFNALRGRYGL